jgi:hypothetical protein
VANQPLRSLEGLATCTRPLSGANPILRGLSLAQAVFTLNDYPIVELQSP